MVDWLGDAYIITSTSSIAGCTLSSIRWLSKLDKSKSSEGLLALAFLPSKSAVRYLERAWSVFRVAKSC